MVWIFKHLARKYLNALLLFLSFFFEPVACFAFLYNEMSRIRIGLARSWALITRQSLLTVMFVGPLAGSKDYLMLRRRWVELSSLGLDVSSWSVFALNLYESISSWSWIPSKNELATSTTYLCLRQLSLAGNRSHSLAQGRQKGFTDHIWREVRHPLERDEYTMIQSSPWLIYKKAQSVFFRRICWPFGDESIYIHFCLIGLSDTFELWSNPLRGQRVHRTCSERAQC